MASGDFSNLTGRRTSDKILCDTAFNIAKNLNYNEDQRGLLLMVYKLFEKSSSGGAIKNEKMLNKELAAELQKPIIKKFEKRKAN